MFRCMFSSFILSAVVALQCQPGQEAGPYTGSCPPGSVLARNERGEEVCCPEEFTIVPTLPTTPFSETPTADQTSVATEAPLITTTTAVGATSGSGNTDSTCVDKKNPRTGVSDCPRLAYLCYDANYIDIMSDQCPKTCGRCSTTSVTSSNGCVDLKNPRTGVSDCPSLAYLCNDSDYYSIMTTQCPKTCGRCGSSGSTIVSTTASTGSCADRINPATGVSECPARSDLCNHSAYRSLMQEQCPRTCGFC